MADVADDARRCEAGTDPRRPAQARHRGSLRRRHVRRALRQGPRGLRPAQVRAQAALGRAQDHDLGALRPGLRHVARRDVRQAVGRGERRRGQGRPHQQRPALQHGGGGGRRPERSRPLLVHLAPVDVPEAGDPRDRPRPGGVEEGRADDEGREEEHVQPADEAVLRLPGDVRARPRPVPAQLPAGGRREPQHLGGPPQGGAEAQADRASGRPRHVERDRLEHDADLAPLLLRRLHPERGEPHRHRAGSEPPGRDPGPRR